MLNDTIGMWAAKSRLEKLYRTNNLVSSADNTEMEEKDKSERPPED